MVRKSTQVALGGLASALCLLLMFLTGLIPFATYAFPALAGVVLIAVVTENGYKTALIVYAAVSLLSLFIVPDKEAVLMFLFFFGYYPVMKGQIEKIKLVPVQLVLKYVLFNISMILAYTIVINVLGMTEILESFGDFGRYSVLVLLAFGNVVFAVYDFALKNIIIVYKDWFRPKFLGRVK